MRKWSFLFILLLLPAGVLAAGQAQKKGSQDISIAISVEESGENTLGDALADTPCEPAERRGCGNVPFLSVP